MLLYKSTSEIFMDRWFNYDAIQLRIVLRYGHFVVVIFTIWFVPITAGG